MRASQIAKSSRCCSIPELQASIERYDHSARWRQLCVGTAIALSAASFPPIDDKNYPCGLCLALASCGTVLTNAAASTNKSTGLHPEL